MGGLASASCLIGCSLSVDGGALSEGCPSDMKDCEGVCVSLSDEDFGCARPTCSPCFLEQATARCSPEGECIVASCVGSFEDCDRNPENGCEKDIEGDVENCGGCGDACDAPERGVAACGRARCYVRSCEEGYGDCNAEFSDGCEADLTSDREHCGVCGNECTLECQQSGCTDARSGD